MLVPGSPAVIWNTPGEPSFVAKRGSSKVFGFPMILKGFWETLSKVDPLQCVAGAPLRQRNGDPATTRICWIAEIFKSVCFPNDFKGILENLIQSRSPPMCCWSTTQAAQRRPCTYADLLRSRILQKCLFTQWF